MRTCAFGPSRSLLALVAVFLEDSDGPSGNVERLNIFLDSVASHFREIPSLVVGGKTMVAAGPLLIEECETCKSPTREASRSLCTTCLNRNLQRACEKTGVQYVISPRMFLGVRRALFPGMPRAVLQPVCLEKGEHASPPWCRTTTTGNSAAPSSGVGSPCGRSEADDSSLCEARKDSQFVKVKLEEISAEGKSFAGGEKESVSRLEETGADSTSEKWHLFQIQKNLTVRIPNPPMDVSTLPGRYKLLVVPAKEDKHNSLPPRKEARARVAVRTSNVRRSAIKPNATAEAELMMRLLSDSIPILKSTAPLVLPPCKVRPAPISPLSPPGDPLWKRRCIPCPKSLKVQVVSLCVN